MWFARLLPVVLPFVFFVGSGVVTGLANSAGLGLPGISDQATLVAYERLLGSSWFWESFIFSLGVAAVSAAAATVLGTYLAWLIWRSEGWVSSLSRVYVIPLILPHIVVAFLTQELFGQSGPISGLAYHTGFITDPSGFPNFLYSGYGVGIILSYTYKGVAFVILMVLSVLRKFDEREVDTALMLGSNLWTAFRRLVLPFIAPVLATTFVILFLFSFGAFEIPFIIGESRPAMLSISVFNLYFQRDIANRPLAMALLMVLLVTAILFISAYYAILRRYNERQRSL